MRNRSHRQEVRTIAEYITADTLMPQFFRYPRFLLKMDLSHTARLLYALLLDRAALSQKNGWQDSEGRTYIVYPVSEITETLDKGSTTIKSALNELDAAKLKENQLNGASGEPPAPFGRYKNVFLSESEYTELKEEYPDRLERFIEELSEFIAATGRMYANHAAAVRMWAKRDRKGTGKKGIPRLYLQGGRKPLTA